MANEVVMPQMGADMTEGTLLKWLKNEGDSVERGEIIAEIETDKANVEIEAFASGTLSGIVAKEGDVIQVGDVMAVILEAGEKAPPTSKKGEPTAAQPPGGNGAQPETRKDVTPQGEVRKEEAATGRGEAGEGAILDREQSEEEADRGLPSPALREQRAQTAAPSSQGPAPVAGEERIKISPIARRMARESGVDLATIRGSGPEGRIVRRDIEALVTARAGEPGPRPMVAPEPETADGRKPGAPPAAGEVIETTRMRGAIARRMSQSKQHAPHFYVTVDVDMAALMEQRSRLNETLDDESKVSINDLIVKASAATLKRFTRFNAHFTDDHLVVFPEIHICVGVALPDGLIAPSIRNCEAKSLVEIARASKDVIGRAREGRLYPHEFDGTFTITNLGAYGVETLIGIINPPQVAILGVGAVQPAPVARNGQVVVAQMMKLALSADHRAVDGANGGEFLAYLKQVLENPLLLA